MEVSFWDLRRRMLRKAALYPGRYDVRYLRGMRSMRDFDDQITARYSGFRDAQDYYTQAAAARVVDRIAVPTLILHAQDDPFIRVTARDAREAVAQSAHYLCRNRARRTLRFPRRSLTATTVAGPSARPLPLSGGWIAVNQSAFRSSD